ncbi:MAG: histidinol-phosphate transaminase [Bacteroidota bacterium]
MFENKFLKGLTPYKLSSHRAWELSIDTEVLKLDWNEATIPPSPLVFERILDAIKKQRLNWYPDVNNVTLIHKLAHYAKVENEEVLYFASSDAIHEYLISAYLEPSDKVVIVGPTYDNFRAAAESGGGDVSFFNLNESFTIDFKLFKEFITRNNPKIVYIVNPNNPTGTFTAIEKLKGLITDYPNILFIIDEAYCEFNGESIADFAVNCLNVIVTRTFSKAFALASFRIGYVISDKLNIKVLSKIRNAKNIPLLSQVAAIAALDSQDYTNKYIAEVSKAREYLYKELSVFDNYIKLYESHANFIFIKFFSKEQKYEFIRFLENYSIFVRDYNHLNSMQNYIRITIGTIEQMKYVNEIIHKFFNIIE